MRESWDLFTELMRYTEAPTAVSREEHQELLSLLGMALEARQLGVWQLDPIRDVMHWDQQQMAIFGIEPEQFGHRFADWRTRVLPEDLAQAEAHLEDFLAGRTKTPVEFRIVRPNGQQRIINGWAVARRAADGTLTRILGMNWDVTEARQLESQVRQSQKMEAIGRLTGGIAHDFNNMLAVILGYLELAQDSQDLAEIKEGIAEAYQAAERGATLTRQLLSFARQQPLAPEYVDPGTLMHGLARMLQRVLGEDIVLDQMIASERWQCLIDPHQLETAIVNLVINARDAMPNGGRLLLEVSNQTLDDSFVDSIEGMVPGTYVCIAVTDTGSGMPPEVLERATEPFFTTKAFGSGTGLGLAMVVGFVQQSGGFLKLYSEVGEGTTVKLFLPRVLADAPARQAAAPLPRVPAGTQQTILVVEDEDRLRELFRRMLSDLGYTVLVASDGRSALALYNQTAQIDALLTDVVLPGGMNGRELAEAIQAQRPGLPTVYMSGYTENALTYRGRLESGVVLLQKPFSRIDLAATFARLLGDDTAIHEDPAA